MNVTLNRWLLAGFSLLMSAGQLSRADQPTDPALNEKIFGGHLDAVTMGAFAADGKAIVTVSFDQTARLWNTETQTELRQYTQHTGPIFCLAVSQDGTTLVTGGQDNTVRIWDLPLGKPLQLLGQHQKPVLAVALSPLDGSIVSASADSNVAVHWLEQEQVDSENRFGHQTEALAVAYRSDGSFFASADADGRILLWSPYLDESQGEILSHIGRVTDVAFLSNNQQLFSAGDDGVVRHWQLMPSTPQEFNLGGKQIVRWSVVPNQSEAVCMGDGGDVFVMNLTNGEIAKQFPKLDFGPRAIAHATNRSWVGIGDDAGKVHLLDFDGTEKAVVVAHEKEIRDIAVHPDSVRFATCDDLSVRIWGQPPSDETPQQPLHVLQANPESPIAITSVAFSPDQQHLIGGGADGSIHIWNVSSGQLVRSLDAHNESENPSIRRLLVTPNAQTVVSIGDDQTLRSFQLSDGSALQTISCSSSLRGLVLSPDSTRAVVAGDDGLVRVYDLASGILLQLIGGHTTPVAAVAYSNDGQAIVSATVDRKLRISKPSIVRAMPVHSEAIRSLATYGGGSQVLTCDSQQIVMTNTSNGSLVRSYRIRFTGAEDSSDASEDEPQYQPIKPTAVSVRDDNQRVVAGTEDGQVFIWNVNDGDNPLLSLNVQGSVTSLAYSSDNQRLAVATSIKQVHVFGPAVPGTEPQSELTLHQTIETGAGVNDVSWDQDSQILHAALDNGKIGKWNYAGLIQRRQLSHSGAVYGVAVSGDGKLAVSCSADQTIRIWDTTTGQQKSQMRGHVGAVHAIAISQDETFAVTSGADGTIRLWDLVGGRQLKQLTKYDETMYSVAIHPNGQLVAAAGADRKIHLLDMISGEEQRTLEGHSDYVHCTQFDATGDRLLSYGYAGFLRIWNPSNGDQLSQLRVGKVGNYAQFSPDGKQIVLSGGDGTVRVVATPQP